MQSVGSLSKLLAPYPSSLIRAQHNSPPSEGGRSRPPLRWRLMIRILTVPLRLLFPPAVIGPDLLRRRFLLLLGPPRDG